MFGHAVLLPCSTRQAEIDKSLDWTKWCGAVANYIKLELLETSNK